MDRVLDRDPTYLRTPLIALIAAISLVIPTAAFASDDPVDPSASEPTAPAEEDPTAEGAPPAGEEEPLPVEQSEPAPAAVEETPSASEAGEASPMPAGETPADTEGAPATGGAGSELPLEGVPVPEFTPPLDPAGELTLVLIEDIESLSEAALDLESGEVNFPVAPAPDNSPPLAQLTPEEVVPTPAPVRPAAPPPSPRPEAPSEPITPVGVAATEPASVRISEPEHGVPPPLPMPATLAPDPKPVALVLPEERLPEPVRSPAPVRPLVVVDPPTVVESEPALIDPAPTTAAATEVVASEVPAAPVSHVPTEDPIFFPTSIAQGGEADPPLAVALEIPFETSGAPPPASSSASASSSSSTGVATGVGPAALAALFVVIAFGAAATVRLSTQAWRSSYLLSLPERPG